MHTVEEVLNAFKRGEMVIIVDDIDRENEGDLVIAAEYATPKAINFMATHGRGLICMPIDADLAQKLAFHPMIENNTDTHQTAFTVSIDAIESTTGISAYERSHTIMKVVSDDVTADDFKRPGHVFPLIAKKGGLRVRRGHTEAAVDLTNLCQLKPAGVICEILNEDGTMARRTDLLQFAHKHQMKMTSIQALVEFMMVQTSSKHIDIPKGIERKGEMTL